MENSKNSKKWKILKIPKKIENSKNSKKNGKFKNTKKLKNKKSAIDENLVNRRHGSKKRFLSRR